MGQTIITFLPYFTCHNFQCASLFLPVVPFSALLYFYLLYLSLCCYIFICYTCVCSVYSLPVYRSRCFIHLVRIVTPFGFPTFISPVLIVWVSYCTVFFISSILNKRSLISIYAHMFSKACSFSLTR